MSVPLSGTFVSGTVPGVGCEEVASPGGFAVAGVVDLSGVAVASGFTVDVPVSVAPLFVSVCGAVVDRSIGSEPVPGRGVVPVGAPFVPG